MKSKKILISLIILDIINLIIFRNDDLSTAIHGILFLGMVGTGFYYFTYKNTKKCPFCQSTIDKKAIICKYCQSKLN